jgi:hypothetical protein
MQLYKKPYDLLSLLALIIVAAAFIFKKTIIVHFHDTYFVISYSMYALPVGLLLSLIWLLCHWTKSVVWSKALTWIHVVFTSLLAAVMILFPSSHTFFELSWNSFRFYNKFSRINYTLSVSLVSLVAIQLLYLVNLIVGLIRLKINRPSTIA